MLNFVMAIQFMAIAVLFTELIFAAVQKPSTMQSHIIIMIISTILLFVGYNVELTATSLDLSLVGAAISYIGKPFVMLSSFMFICSFYNQQIPRALYIFLSVFSTLFAVLVFTNKYHYLYYATTVYDATQAYSPLVVTRGPLYYLYMAYAVVYFVACIYVIVINYRNSQNRANRPLAIYLIMMILSAGAGYLLFLMNIGNGYDVTMAGVFLSSIFLFILFVRYRIFDTLTLAKDQALENSANGLIVLNQNDEVVYSNAIVKTFFENGVLFDELKKIRKENSTFSVNGFTYAVKMHRIIDNRSYLGKSIEISDVTNSANYQNRLRMEIDERTAELENMQREIVASIANIVEARSEETGEHVKRTSIYTRIIAEELLKEGYFTNTLNEEYIRLLVSAAALHDIGKLSIPDEVLLKKGKLSSEEFKIMQSHTTAGAEIIEKTMRGLESEEYVQMAEDVARYHHEQRDGKGYPSGLYGNQIPLSARIVSLADSFDALTSERCYKGAYSKEEAIRLISEESGSRFDPIIVEAFKKAIADIDLKELNQNIH